ncbi:MAG: flagellar motor protein MotA, partial [Rhodospirillaceae bacterium]|nr:flagellar motor protein MotA [Rhodospirillaceae bacterium]
QELQRIMARTEQSRAAGNEQFAAMNDKLTILTEQMRTETQVLLRLAENQKELTPLLKRLNEGAGSQNSGLDDITKGHIRSIDAVLIRLAGNLDGGREDMLREIRAEMKLLAKTIAATAGQSGQRDDGSGA